MLELDADSGWQLLIALVDGSDNLVGEVDKRLTGNRILSGDWGTGVAGVGNRCYEGNLGEQPQVSSARRMPPSRPKM